jgi:hypothetical protein
LITNQWRQGTVDLHTQMRKFLILAANQVMGESILFPIPYTNFETYVCIIMYLFYNFVFIESC